VRIAQVVSSYHPRIGGVETHVQRLAQGCAEAGDYVTILTHQVSSFCTDERADTIRILRFPLTLSSHNYPISLSLFRYLRVHAADFDVVHAHNYHTLVGHAAIIGRRPFVFTPHYHGTGHTPLASRLHRLYRQVGARQFTVADAVICVSEAERDLVIRDFPDATEKTVVIPNGTDARQITAARSENESFSEPMVLTVGRLERYKNVDLIITAFQALPIAATLVVVGDGPDRARLERHAEASKPDRNVVFAGRISDVELGRLFAEANVITSASDHEAFGLTLAEGLASGARVVASAIPAHEALGRLAGAECPIALVDPRDTKEFTGLLAASLSAGRADAGNAELPSWAHVVRKTREIYSRVGLQSHPTNGKGSDMPQRAFPPLAAERASPE
jgi:glycosyltransferase involved in cell wall biosynthesis